MLKVIKRWFSFFTADWCPDCQFIYPVMPEIEALHPDMTFVRVNRDDYMALAQTWNIFGIPSFVVTQKGQELGRLVNKARKKPNEEINAFLIGDLKDENSITFLISLLIFQKSKRKVSDRKKIEEIIEELCQILVEHSKS